MHPAARGAQPQCLFSVLQARGRARAQNSMYSVLAKANSREVYREQLNESLVGLMERAIRAVQAMPEREYRLKVSAGRAALLLLASACGHTDSALPLRQCWLLERGSENCMAQHISVLPCSSCSLGCYISLWPQLLLHLQPVCIILADPILLPLCPPCRSWSCREMLFSAGK